jgi:ATP-dependent RNA helicase RhlB
MLFTVDGPQPIPEEESEAVLGPSLAEGGSDPVSPEAAPNDQPETRAVRPNFLTSTRFADLTLPKEIMSGLDAAGFECCTPIQAQVIPVAMEGYDIAGQAQTGTGKTTAFLVPLLARLLKRPPLLVGLPRALIISPTRELALQIYQDCKILTGSTQLTETLIIGGVEYKEQSKSLESGPDIVIGTPGRIIDFLSQGVFDPRAVEVAVVDEADRLLDLGFIRDLKQILRKLPPYTHRQTMLFSATLDDRVLELTYEFMNPPQYITAEPDPGSKELIDQILYHVSLDEKLALLLGLLKHEQHNRVIIFCNTKSTVEWLTKKLVLNKFQAEGITGDLPQPKRLRLMEDFKEQRLQIMVATDVASRGIHVEDVSHVYNFDLPQDAENYIHRIGRTARAGKSGKAVSFACEDHVFHLEAIENILGEKIPVVFADEDLYVPDETSPVRVKDRAPHSRKRLPDRNGDRFGDRKFEDSRVRGPAHSSRAGGIFGLSPLQPVTFDNPDVRQVLSWTPAGLEGLAAGTETEGSGDKKADSREGRRRKRRRSKGARDGEQVSGFQSGPGVQVGPETEDLTLPTPGFDEEAAMAAQELNPLDAGANEANYYGPPVGFYASDGQAETEAPVAPEEIEEIEGIEAFEEIDAPGGDFFVSQPASEVPLKEASYAFNGYYDGNSPLDSPSGRPETESGAPAETFVPLGQEKPGGFGHLGQNEAEADSESAPQGVWETDSLQSQGLTKAPFPMSGSSLEVKSEVFGETSPAGSGESAPEPSLGPPEPGHGPKMPGRGRAKMAADSTDPPKPKKKTGPKKSPIPFGPGEDTAAQPDILTQKEPKPKAAPKPRVQKPRVKKEPGPILESAQSGAETKKVRAKKSPASIARTVGEPGAETKSPPKSRKKAPETVSE